MEPKIRRKIGNVIDSAGKNLEGGYWYDWLRKIKLTKNEKRNLGKLKLKFSFLVILIFHIKH